MPKIYDMIIIGGGTAGMTAAIYAHRAKRDLLIIEKAFFGGQIISASEVENYPGFKPSSGYDFAMEISEQIDSMNITKISDKVSAILRASEKHDADKEKKKIIKPIWQILCSNSTYLCRTVIIAVGTVNRKPGLPYEEKYVGHGLSYCATCDGAFYKDKTVAVMGGGNSAMEEALYLALLCKNVYLIHRRNKLKGEKSLQDRIFDSDNIKVFFNTEVVSLHGDRKLEKIEISGPNERKSNETSVLQTDCLFVAIGQVPQNSAFSEIVSLDKNGYIMAGEDCHTSTDGIFAAGDCRTKALRQLVTAAADGARAASEAIKYLEH